MAEVPKSASPGLPTVEDLEQLWGFLYSQLRTLRALNLEDRAFLKELWDRQRALGRRCSKHLFDIWLSLQAPPRTVLEVGCRTGLSVINKLFLHPNAERVSCVLVDLWNEWGSPGVVLRNLAHIGVPRDRISFLNGDSRQLLPALQKALNGLRFDYVLIDGSHDKDVARTDLQIGLQLVALDGWLVFDDTGPDDDGGPGCDLLSVWNDVMAGQTDRFETKHYDVPYGFAAARGTAASTHG